MTTALIEKVSLADKLAKVRETIKTRGRTTGDLEAGRGGRVCLLGGVGVAVVDGYTGDHGYYPFRKGGEARDVVEALLAQLPERFLQQTYGCEDRPEFEGAGFELDYEDLYDFNDVHADDDEVDKLIADAIAAARAA